MKIHNGFISNSSSASFTISLTSIPEDKRIKLFSILDDIMCGGWDAKVSKYNITFHTYMDNWNPLPFIRKETDISKKAITHFDHSNGIWAGTQTMLDFMWDEEYEDISEYLEKEMDAISNIHDFKSFIEDLD